MLHSDDSEVESLRAEVARLTSELAKANADIQALMIALRAMYAEAITG